MQTADYFYHYLFIGIFIVATLLFSVAAIVLAYLVAPKKPSAIKKTSYECGLESEGDPWIRFRIQYYIFALIFVIFDIETIFIYPWAVAFKKLGLFAFVEMVIFISILAIGLVYGWRKKVLEWE
ncbi:MAG: NADH-quinone oxidoreductase subunit A [Candidatus Omnitrophica bacterium]|nr:NADH-quinone oxidoreductase subunit A [Candidatus Omnitrophota bacterium]